MSYLSSSYNGPQDRPSFPTQQNCLRWWPLNLRTFLHRLLVGNEVIVNSLLPRVLPLSLRSGKTGAKSQWPVTSYREERRSKHLGGDWKLAIINSQLYLRLSYNQALQGCTDLSLQRKYNLNQCTIYLFNFFDNLQKS